MNKHSFVKSSLAALLLSMMTTNAVAEERQWLAGVTSS